MKPISCFIIAVLCSRPAISQIEISGTVQDQSSRHTLSNANVYLTVERSGTVTDNHGRFKLASSGGLDTLVVSLLGYESKRVAIRSEGAGRKSINLELTRKLLIIDDLVVSADRYKDQVVSLNMDAGSARIDLNQIRGMPYTLFPDINKSLQLLPGVMSTNELTDELNIRGGSPDQNLVLLDGVPVYYPYHIFGIASAFNPDMIGEVQFSPGGFSAKYGNRLSSVVSILPHIPRKKIEVSSDISLIAANVTAAGDCKNLEWLFSTRKSYYNYLAGSFGGGAPYYFYDLFGRLSWTLNARNTLSIMAFGFRDRFGDEHHSEGWLYSDESPTDDHIVYKDFETQSFSWANRLWSLAWDSRFSDKISSHLQLYSSVAENNFTKEYRSEFPSNLPDAYQAPKAEVLNRHKLNEIDVANGFGDISMTGSLLWKASANTRLDAGFEFNSFSTDYGWGQSGLPETAVYDYNDQVKLYFDHAPANEFAYNKKVRLANGFAEVLLGESKPLKMRAGIRANKWSNHTAANVEPRLSISYNVNRFAFKCSAGHFTQGIATALEGGFVGFLDLYFPVEDSLKIESSDHYTTSIEYQNKQGPLTKAVITGYYKVNSNLIKAIGPAPNFIQTPGRAYGIELSLQGQWQKCSWWSSAMLSRVYRIMDGIKVDTNWDRRYNFNISASRMLFKNWRFSCAWFIASGVPYAPDQYYAIYHSANWMRKDLRDSYDVMEVDVPPGRIRYPWYHRLDISMGKEFHFSTIHLEAYFSVRNAYARQNVLYYNPISLILHPNAGPPIATGGPTSST